MRVSSFGRHSHKRHCKGHCKGHHEGHHEGHHHVEDSPDHSTPRLRARCVPGLPGVESPLELAGSHPAHPTVVGSAGVMPRTGLELTHGPCCAAARLSGATGYL